MTEVFGPVVDGQTRCIHYATPLDVVAIEFACCGRFYPCYRCHDQSVQHARRTWPAEQFDAFAVLCGVCTTPMTIDNYLAVTACPNCEAAFNPGCKSHHHLYFDVSS